MKKSIIAIIAAVSFNASAYTVNLNDLSSWENNMRDRFSVPNQIKKSQEVYCIADLTNEITGEITKGNSFNLSGPYEMQGGDRVYTEQDETGSTVVYVNPKTGRGSISMMDNSQVIASGNIKCKF
ncbi:hypothetical protein [Salmonella phage SSBI34]|nr:hypothetical protein [Salmonella phage SSBI34]